jgi:hypothetical protein
MGTKRPKLTIASEIINIAVPTVCGLYWLYCRVSASGNLWTGKMNWLIIPLGILFVANILFSIASRRQAKSIPAKVHAGRVDGEIAALFRHYSACSSVLARRLEELWHHWNNAREVLLYPLGDNPLKNPDHYGSIDLELRDFRLIYGEHLSWLAWEIPEFSTTLPPLGSDREYRGLLEDLKTHAGALDEAAKLIYKSQPVEKVQGE